jgi:tetratricopeptide (TPR) repeat protein
MAVSTGYSSQGGIALMKRFQKLEADESDPHRAGSSIEEFAKVSVDSLGQYFQSHPHASERLAAMQSEISSQGWPETPLRPLAIRNIFLTDQAQALDAKGEFARSIVRYKEALALQPNYVRAWHGLAEAAWRSGDAAETASAAWEAARRAKAARDWRLLARALSVTEQRKAPADFSQDMSWAYGDETKTDSYLASAVELAGLQMINGNDADATRLLRTALASGSSFSTVFRTQMQRELAWWMYRAGKLEDAARVLQDAHQSLPQESETMNQLAWVYTDMGRQADASQSPSAGYSPVTQGEDNAVLAVIAVRTNQHESANLQFKTACEYDPVWLVPRWVQNNFSNSTATILKQLQIEELARRKKVADELARQRKETESKEHPKE